MNKYDIQMKDEDLEIFIKDIECFTTDDANMLQGFATLAEQSIRRARLYESWSHSLN